MTAINHRLAAAVLYLVGTATASADVTSQTDGDALMELRVVGFSQYFPSYPSSASQNLTVLPLPLPVYRGRFLQFGENLENLAKGKLIESSRVDLSIGVNASFPEDSDNLDRRRGMPDLDFLLEAGPELRIALGDPSNDERDLTLSMQVRAAASIDRSDIKGRGVIFNPELEYRLRNVFDEKTELRFRVSPAWATRDYMDYYFGVADEFATPERPAYSTEPGYLNTEFLVGLQRRLSERLELRTSLRLWVNEGSANRHSPLYERDYDRGIRMSLFWTAWQSKRKVR